MSETYDLQWIADVLGLKSKHAARKRVDAIRPSLEKRSYIVYDPQRGNALNVTLDGLNLLQRMNDIPGTIAEQAAVIMTELGDEEAPPDEAELRAFKQDFREWKARHDDEHRHLTKRLEDLGQQVTDLAAIIENKPGWWARIFGRFSLPDSNS